MNRKKRFLINLLITLSITVCIFYLLRVPIYRIYARMQPSSNLFPIELNGKWGYMDNSGKIRIMPQFYGAKDFSCGRAAVEVENTKDSWGFIDTRGKIVIQPKHYYPGDFVDGYSRVWNKNGEDFYINIFGKTVEAQHYIDGPLLAIEDDHKIYRGLEWFRDSESGKCGYKNKNDKVVIAPQFDIAVRFSDGLAMVQNGEKCGFINTKGKIMIPYQFDIAQPFSDGLSLAGKEEVGQITWFFINKSGKKVIDIPKEYGQPSFFHHGLAKVNIKDKLAYINHEGKLIQPHF